MEKRIIGNSCVIIFFMREKSVLIIKNIIIVLFFVVAATCVRNHTFDTVWGKAISFAFVTSVYLGLLAAWGISIQRRITERKTRHYLLNIMGSLMLWVFFRDLYHEFSRDSAFENLSWYGYYLAMALVAVNMLYMSIYMGRGKSYKAPKYYRIIVVISAVLVTGIMTNDYHELAFGVKENTTHPGHGPVYFAMAAWLVILILASIVHSYIRYDEKDMRNKRVWPLGFLALGAVYFIVYYIQDGSKHGVGAVEILLAFCLLIIGVLEVLIQTGLIPSNSDYEWCLTHSTLHIGIMDDVGNAVYFSPDMYPVNEKLFSELLKSESLVVEGRRELNLDPINGGFVIRENDLSEINEVMAELDDSQNDLQAAMFILKNNISVEGRKQQLEARNRLYDLIISKITLQLTAMEDRVKAAKTADEETFRRLIREINIIGVYVKRKSNLILVEEMQDKDLGRELKLCFKETFDNLNRAGIDADFMFREIPTINIDMALIIYDFLETVIENGMYRIQSLHSVTSDSETTLLMTVNVVLKQGLVATDERLNAAFADWKTLLDDNYGGTIETENEGNEYSLMLTLPKGGGVK